VVPGGRKNGRFGRIGPFRPRSVLRLHINKRMPTSVDLQVR
jgi:hypothetical protein